MAKNTIRQKKKPMSLRHQEPKGPQVFFFFWGRMGCWILFFSMCSHEVLNVFSWIPNGFSTHSSSFQLLLTLFHFLCLKLCSSNLYNQPKGGDYNISILGLFKASPIFVFVMDQSKMPITKQKEKNFGGPHN
jgi:hypothetical protein